jgi:Family of unknown function (DUF5995)
MTARRRGQVRKSAHPADRPFRTVDDVVEILTELESIFATRHDKRGIFVSAYIPITVEIQRRIRAGAFEDNAWVSRYLLAFANLYRQALTADQHRQSAAVPRPWRIAFDETRHGSAIVLQHLILGINAHINHDLPLALSQVGIDPQRAERQRDHTAVNEALWAATNDVQQRLAKLYDPLLGVLDLLGGPFDELFTNFSFDVARQAAWDAGVRLVDAAGGPERATVQRQIEGAAAALAEVILEPNRCVAPLLRVLAVAEAMRGDWAVALPSHLWAAAR